jgi:hypothetical protein
MSREMLPEQAVRAMAANRWLVGLAASKQTVRQADRQLRGQLQLQLHRNFTFVTTVR